jgi:hypothetical protein
MPKLPGFLVQRIRNSKFGIRNSKFGIRNSENSRNSELTTGDRKIPKIYFIVWKPKQIADNLISIHLFGPYRSHSLSRKSFISGQGWSERGRAKERRKRHHQRMGTVSKHFVCAWTRPQAHQGGGFLSNPGYASRVTCKAYPPPFPPLSLGAKL